MIHFPFSLVFGERIRKEQLMMITSNVFRRKCINEKSSQPPKDNKRQVIMLKVPQVSVIPNNCYAQIPGKDLGVSEILSQEHKGRFTSYLYANREQGCLSHWRACATPFSAPWNRLWEPALLTLHCTAGAETPMPRRKTERDILSIR